MLTAIGGYYYVITAGGDETIAGQAKHWETNHLIYKAHDYLKHDYADILDLSDNLKWDLRGQIVGWSDALVRNSFVHYSTVGMSLLLLDIIVPIN